MDNELDLLLGRVIDDLLKLDLVLLLRKETGAYAPDDLAARLGRPTEAVSRALGDLAKVGMVERFALGTGRFVMYGSSEDTHIQELVELLHAHYCGEPEARAEVVRKVLRMAAETAKQSPSV